MAWNDEEVQSWRSRSDVVLFGPFVFPLLYHEDFVRSLVFRQEDELGEVRSRDLHFFNFVKVCVIFFMRVGACCLTAFVGFRRSDRYSHNDCNSNWKAMLLNRVVVGRGYKMTVDNTTMTEPPAGYDSVSVVAPKSFCEVLMKNQVLAEVGARLNYDELVVYTNDAIRPSYLVMYDTP